MYSLCSETMATTKEKLHEFCCLFDHMRTFMLCYLLKPHFPFGPFVSNLAIDSSPLFPSAGSRECLHEEIHETKQPTWKILAVLAADIYDLYGVHY